MEIKSRCQMIKCVESVEQPPDSDTLPCCHAYVKSDPLQEKKNKKLNADKSSN